MELGDVWDDYRENRSADTRARLTLQYSPLVKYVAGRVGDGSTQCLEKGLDGLRAAIEGFDYDGKFETYALDCISEAVTDGFSWDFGWEDA